jgi:hypothetical protein
MSIGAGAGTALADPPAQTHNYFAQVAVGTRPDDRAGIRGPNAPSFMTAPAQNSAVRPDDRAGIRGIDSTTVAATQLSLGGASGFDWSDAGVGAGSTLGLILIASGLLVARSRLRAPALRV